MTTTISRAALITGTSSGIGKATALRLVDAGYTVYATGLEVENLEDLRAAGCRTMALDVTDEASMRRVVAAIENEHGAVGVLINNAGYSESGTIEEVSIDRLRRQFETNVFGAIRLVQMVLPGMRRQGWGKIVNLSSMGGKLTFPGGGAYHASKYALEAFSDALRFEVSGFGIDVIIMEPGLIRTGFAAAAVKSMKGEASTTGVYAELNEAIARNTRDAYEKGFFSKLGGEPDDVAKVIAKAVSARRPKTRYTVTASAKLLLTQRALMSDRMWDAFMRSQFPQPKSKLLVPAAAE